MFATTALLVLIIDRFACFLQIYRLVLQGQVDKVLSLLSRSVAAHTEGFQSMRDLLRKMPVSHVSDLLFISLQKY